MKITCATCIYYFVSHDPARPWACKKFGFKSRVLPNFEVKRTTGMDCAYFTMKKRKVHRENKRYGNKVKK